MRHCSRPDAPVLWRRGKWECLFLAGKQVPPSIRLTAFSCAHCGTLTTQFWYDLGVQQKAKDDVPVVWTPDRVAEVRKEQAGNRDLDEEFWESLEQLATGAPFLDGDGGNPRKFLRNVSVSRCYECDQFSIWLHDRLIWPALTDAPQPNPDIPAPIASDFREAAAILPASPRGAAALLRLCVQKLCAHLGEKGRNIDDDIASMVKKGLDVRVQKALDIVRVIGNEAVHPGQIDLNDNRGTAEELFRLVNLIADIMISQPKHIREMYESLPAGKLKAIERRDGESRSATAAEPLAIEAPPDKADH